VIYPILYKWVPS